MTSKLSIHPQQHDTDAQRAAGATPAIQDLLSAVAEANREAQLESLSSVAAAVPTDATGPATSLVADLTTIVERIREHYRTLADLEIRRALEAGP